MRHILIILALALLVVSPHSIIYADAQFIMKGEMHPPIEDVQQLSLPPWIGGTFQSRLVERQFLAGLENPAYPNCWTPTFTSHLTTPQGNNITVQTLFNTSSPTIEKRITMEYRQERFSYTITLQHQGNPYKQAQEGAWQLYYRDNETIAYSQTNDPIKQDISLKEWIYTLQPNTETGSRYLWHFRNDTPNSFLTLREANDGSVQLYRSVPLNISGINPLDTKKRQHIIDTVRKVLGNKIRIEDPQLIAKLSLLIYWTKQGIKKTGTFTIINNNILAVSINEPASSYPLLIDPTISWGQWLGGAGDDVVNAIAVNGDEIYAGGWSNHPASWETVP